MFLLPAPFSYLWSVSLFLYLKTRNKKERRKHLISDFFLDLTVYFPSASWWTMDQSYANFITHPGPSKIFYVYT
jgi:hypothetical protein